MDEHIARTESAAIAAFGGSNDGNDDKKDYHQDNQSNKVGKSVMHLPIVVAPVVILLLRQILGTVLPRKARGPIGIDRRHIELCAIGQIGADDHSVKLLPVTAAGK